jgi:beta-galactosidase
MAVDFKGINFMVLLDGKNVNLEDWTVCPLPLNTVQPALQNAANLRYPPPGSAFTPTIFCGPFNTKNGNDTFLDPRGWEKGIAYLNEVNLGRYWPTEGPQITLYAPGVYFNSKQGENVICLFEIETANPDGSVAFLDAPILDKHKEGQSDSDDIVDF